MSDLSEVAADLAMWQSAALKLPLPEVSSIAAGCFNGLAEELNAFNEFVVADPDGGQPVDALAAAVVKVVRQAAAAAIFTLGARQRTGRQTTALN